jgi:MFS family permease
VNATGEDPIMTASDASTSRPSEIPRGVWILGFVSMFADMSSEMIHALLPIYLVTALGTSALVVGFIEGIAESTAMITKIFSGALSDWLGQRKGLAMAGYALAAATKPVFALATSVGVMAAARFIDRIGKGIRGAPRDALVADLSPAYLRGASFGLRQSLDTVGAFLGPTAAIVLMALTGSFTTVFWLALIPAVLSVCLIIGVEEPASRRPGAPRLRLSDAKRLHSSFWAVVAIATTLALARFSEAFLLLRSQSVGLRIALVPAVLVVMNIVYALSAYPAGVLADQFGRDDILAIGIGLLVVADLLLGFGATIAAVLLGVVFWGLHMGLSQGLLAALVADAAPVELRGTAFGLFNLATGIAIFIASVIAGALWDAYGPRAAFTAGAMLAGVALAGLAVVALVRISAR